MCGTILKILSKYGFRVSSTNDLHMKFLKTMCGFLFPLLGIASSCDSIGGACEYGVPNADFEIKGKVTDIDDNPVRGIKITGTDIHTTDVLGETGNDGTFEVSFNGFPSRKVKLQFTDDDGIENGGDFGVRTVEVDVVQVVEPSKDDSSWYEGKFSGSVDVKLKSSDSDTEING